LQLRALRLVGPLPEILAHRQGAERHDAPGMRLGQLAACVINNIPGRGLIGIFLQIVGQQGLGEIFVVELFAPRQFEDLAAQTSVNIGRGKVSAMVSPG
jgi:hypothetical protein